MAKLIELKVPDIGDFDTVEIIEVLVNVGDSISENQDIITLESDKAAMEIPSLHNGTISEMRVAIGDSVKEGSVIAILSVESADTVVSISELPTPIIEKKPEITETSPATVTNSTTKPTKNSPEITSSQSVTNSDFTTIHASPSVRKFARELDVDLSRLNGTGIKNRITKDDVQNFIKKTINHQNTNATGATIPSIPVIDFSKFGNTETQSLSRIKKISGNHLHACWLNIPHITQFDKADITELEQFRQDNKKMAAAQDINLTPLVFVMKAVVAVLKRFPEFNASLDESKENLIIKNYYNLGIAIDTPNGLMVPVINDVDKKGFLDLAQELGELSLKARDGKLSANDLQGGTFTISSLGGIGGSFFTPIVNAPEVAILGVGRHATEAIWDGNQFIPRLMLPLSVSYDHRVIDGASGARFTVALSQMLTDIRKVLL